MPNKFLPFEHNPDRFSEEVFQLSDSELDALLLQSFERDAGAGRLLDSTRNELPIIPHLSAIAEALEKHDRVIITGEPGIGKTTQVPQFFARLGYRVIHTLPTRLAVTSLQAEVERQLGGENGEVVGFKHRRAEIIGKNFKIMFCTDGLCFERVLRDRFFNPRIATTSRDLLIIDEAHVANLNIEHTLALYRKYLPCGSAPKLIVMSATINPHEIARFLSVPGDPRYSEAAQVFEIEGRQFPITDLQPGESRISDILEHIERGRGHVIDFYPGAGEIRQMQRELKRYSHGAMVIPLHAKLSPEAQDLVHQESDRVKVILATNVAETSLTISGVTTVMNGGLERVLVVEGDEEMLLPRVNSRSTYQQRRGRCGRDGEGFFINRGHPEHLLPEGYWDSLQLPLHKHTLKLLVAGEDPMEVVLPHDPGLEKRQESITWLQRHGFIATDRMPTSLGVFAASLPVEPREAKAIHYAMEHRDSTPAILGSVIDVAAILSVRDFRQRGDDSLYNLIDPSLHPSIQRAEVLGNLCALEAIYAEPSASVRSRLFKRFGIREAAADEALLLREEMAEQLNVSTRPIGSNKLQTAAVDLLLEASAQPWSDYIYQFIGRTRSGRALYRNILDPEAPPRQLSRYAHLGEPLLVTGKPFSIGLAPKIQSEHDIIRLITQACVIPSSWYASNPALRELEHEANEFRKAGQREQRRQLHSGQSARRKQNQASKKKRGTR